MKTLLFVDDETNVLQGLQRQLRPMRHEWDMNFVVGGHAALDFMAQRPVDIIVSDMMMPGMDGAQLLSEVVKRHPQTVRIILSGHAARETVLRLVGPAHQYLSKPCEPDELRKAIGRALGMRELLGNERLKQLTTRIKNLPTLTAMQNQLAEELQQDSPSVERVGEIISRDIGMTAKILQLVNSAFFGLAQPVNSPTDAAAYLGMNTIRSLALSVEIFSQYNQKNCRWFSLNVLAQHSWATGVMARHLAQLERQKIGMLEQCFLAGLVHDIGQLILAFGLEQEYSDVIERAKSQNVPVWQVEQAAFGATHADVGAYLLALWGLPDAIIEAVSKHHQPAQCGATAFSATLAVHAADVFAHEFAATDTEVPPPKLDTEYLSQLGFVEKINDWQNGCKAVIEH